MTVAAEIHLLFRLQTSELMHPGAQAYPRQEGETTCTPEDSPTATGIKVLSFYLQTYNQQKSLIPAILHNPLSSNRPIIVDKVKTKKTLD